MENPTISDPTWKPGSEERTKEKPYLRDHPKAQTAKSGTYHKCDNGDGGLARKCSIAMRSSYHCPCSMMTKRMPQKSGFSGLSWWISMKCYKKLHEITTENTARCLIMSVLQMLQMLQRFFAHKHKNGFFESVEDFAGYAIAATIGAHDGQSLLRLRTLCKGYPCQSDYTFWEGYTAENKIRGVGRKSRSFLIDK